MSACFHSADKPTYRRVMLVGFMFCALFVAISFLSRQEDQTDYVLVKADKLVRTAGQHVKAN